MGDWDYHKTLWTGYKGRGGTKLVKEVTAARWENGAEKVDELY